MLNSLKPLKYIDLFCGIGGFRIATETVCKNYNLMPICVFSSDWDLDAQKTYQANFNEFPQGDLTKIPVEAIPKHDLLLAGFPCQPFSICGKLNGFEDIRGTAFFDIARILDYHQPEALILENVKQLVGHQKGKTLQIILEVLRNLGYYVEYKVLNALNFGLPQKRERVFIVGVRQPVGIQWNFPSFPRKSLSEIIENNVPKNYYASARIQENRLAKYTGKMNKEPTIWHENKAGHISAYPYSCAIRAGASYNYLLVDGKRRLTEREMLRLQGFPDDFQVVCSYTAMRKLVGNSVAIPCVRAVLECLLQSLMNPSSKNTEKKYTQLSLFDQNVN